MSSNHQSTWIEDPFQVLALPQGASEQAIRTRYLELVKRHPPDREPEKFRRIRAAYDLARDPVALARRMIRSGAPNEPPSWESAIDQQAQLPPRMAPDFLLSLGNRPTNNKPPISSNHKPAS